MTACVRVCVFETPPLGHWGPLELHSTSNVHTLLTSEANIVLLLHYSYLKTLVTKLLVAGIHDYIMKHT